MHDTALKIGGLVMRTYCPPKQPSILEIGSQDINGSLRELAPKRADYVGLDFEAGKGVDIVLQPGKPWPVEDDTYDLVLASSVFEHDVAFWVTFEAMCRKAKPGGHIYISAPSNGIVHRCPQDYWRFYPDSGLALKEWAARQELDVTLVESFVAEREADMWNDFCAIFRREPSPEPLNRNYVHQKVACTNVITWESEEVLNPRENPQDILLIAEAREEAQKLQAHINWREHVMAGEKSAWEGERQELVRNAAAASVAREALAIEKAEQERKFEEEREASIRNEQALREQIQAVEAQISAVKAELKEREQQVGQLTSNLEQRRAEIEQAWSEAEEARKAQQAAEQISKDERQRVGHLGRELNDAQELIRKLSEEQQAAEARARQLTKQIQKVERTNRNITRELTRLQSAAGRLHQSEQAARSELAERVEDLAQLTSDLVQQEDKLRWLREVHASLRTRPWWWALVSRRWQRRLELRHLARAGLFDWRVYLEERPDVRDSGQHPLQHYIDHGMDETIPNTSFWSR